MKDISLVDVGTCAGAKRKPVGNWCNCLRTLLLMWGCGLLLGKVSQKRPANKSLAHLKTAKNISAKIPTPWTILNSGCIVVYEIMLFNLFRTLIANTSLDCTSNGATTKNCSMRCSFSEQAVSKPESKQRLRSVQWQCCAAHSWASSQVLCRVYQALHSGLLLSHNCICFKGSSGHHCLFPLQRQ